jgi:hypothetical protein
MLINPQLQVDQANNLRSMTQHLERNLEAVQPNNSERIQTIAYALIGTALVGIMVYHYIKAEEESRAFANCRRK